MAVPDRFDAWHAERTVLLESRLQEIDAISSAGRLVEGAITAEGLSISPIRKDESDESDDVARRLYGMLPRVRITELLAEVNGWTGFSERFSHLRTGAPPEENIDLMTPLLDRLTHRCHILETGNDSFCFKNSSAKAAKPAKEKFRNLTNA